MVTTDGNDDLDPWVRFERTQAALRAAQTAATCAEAERTLWLLLRRAMEEVAMAQCEEERDRWDRLRLAVREALATRYLGVVNFWACKLAHKVPWVELEDLKGLAAIGLVEALDHFDLSIGGAFSTYVRYRICAVIWDSNEVTRGLPRRLDEQRRAARRAHDELMIALDRQPTLEEIATETGLAPNAVSAALAAEAMAFATPLPDSDAWEGRPSPTSMDTDVAMTVDVRQQLETLSKREQQVLVLKFWLKHDDSAIASQTGLTKGNVKVIRFRALKKLRLVLSVMAGNAKAKDVVPGLDRKPWRLFRRLRP